MIFKHTKVRLSSLLALGMFTVFLLAPVLWTTMA